MSILLESLNQQTDENRNQNLPDIHSSHFDDEMLGDEALYKQLKLWKAATLALLILLLVSWGGVYFNSGAETTSIVVSTKTPLIIKETPPNNVVAKIETEELKKTPEIQQEISVDNKAIYKPEKRMSKTIKNKPSDRIVEQQKITTNRDITKASGAAIFKDELPLELQNKFPQIQIDSYVIADTADDSFVILDGSFYKNNQVISPNLILRNITTENVIVEFHSYLVKLPLSN